MARAIRKEALARDVRADNEAFLDLLCRERRGFVLPPQMRELSERFVWGLLELLFPHFSYEVRDRHGEVVAEQAALRELLARALELPASPAEDRHAVIDRFFAELPAIREALLLDAKAIYDGDPAAKSVDEVILAYPGFFAIAVYRLAHELESAGVPLLPRLICEIAHRNTGIDIHPGARIGGSIAIDHGTGIVIGETAVLGTRVKLYQGVTLGAMSVSKRLQRLKRHPTIGDDVVIYANATILGGDTVIGSGSRIGGNVWLTRSVPPNSIVTPRAWVGHTKTEPAGDDLLDFNI